MPDDEKPTIAALAEMFESLEQDVKDSAEETGPNLSIRIKLLAHGINVPVYASSGAAGADLAAAIPEPVIIPPQGHACIPTGVCMEIPAGYEGQVRSRGGLGCLRKVGITHGTGTVDCDYRGEIMVYLTNHSDEDQEIKPGDRVAQIIFAKVYRARFTEAVNFSETKRGNKGFGSTGR